MPKIAPLFAPHFTVITYDRRGRGGSSDTQPYEPAREVEDLQALIGVVGGSASLLGLSSGAALALEAAAAGLPVEKLVMYEPPYIAPATGALPNHEARLKELIATNQRGAAVRYFMRDMVNVPAPVVWIMTLMVPIFSKLKAVAHTLPYDSAVMRGFRLPKERAASIRVPTLVMAGSKTQPRLLEAIDTLARTIPGAKKVILEGQTHNVAAQALAPPVIDFLETTLAPSRPVLRAVS
jgi:pimeloyl-ACP methyl ester carboxylesterase